MLHLSLCFTWSLDSGINSLQVDEEINGVDSRYNVKHNEWSDQLFLERMMTVSEHEE